VTFLQNARPPVPNKSFAAARADRDDGAVTPTAPERTDGVVILRAFLPEDVDEIVVMGRDPDTVRYTSMPHPYERRHAEEWVAEPGKDRDTLVCWAIEVDGRFAGSVDLRGHPAEIGFVLAPWARGRGHMTRAMRLATRWAFDAAGLPIVHWRAHAGNLASWRAAHACGFGFHAEQPLAIPHRGALYDAWLASLRATDDGRPRTTWWPTPVLEDDRVRLRPAVDADIPRITEACRDPRTRYWLPDLPDPYTEDEARAFVRQGQLESSLGRRVGWVVADPADDRLLARISVFRLADPLNPTGAEIGYWAHPDARGRGVVSAALDLVVAHAFTPTTEGGLGRHRLQIGTAWGNSASRHVAEQAGFTMVGHFHADGIVGRGVLDDGAWYELLR
jgi:RimJ/RimL family protein N-acetyltransferase